MVWAIVVFTMAATLAAVLSYRLNWFGVADQEVGAYDGGLNFWTKNASDSWDFWAKKPAMSKDIVIIAIDEKTLLEIESNPQYKAKFGTWPYNRDIWAWIFQYLDQKAHPKAIVFDALLTNQTKNTNQMIASIKNSKTPILVGFTFATNGMDLPKVLVPNRLANGPQLPKNDDPLGDTSDPTKLAEHAARTLVFPVQTQDLALGTYPLQEGINKTESGQKMQLVLNPLPPMQPLWDVAAGFGLVMTESTDSSDGKLRATRFAYTDGKNAYATLSLATMADVWAADHAQIRPGQLTLGDHHIRINQDGSAGIQYGGTLAQRFRVVSLVDVLAEALSPSEQSSELASLFAEKLVLIGGFAAGLSGTQDLRDTPFESFAPGVVKHAAEIDCLMHNNFIVDAPFWSSVLITFLTALISVLVILVFQSDRLEIVWPIALFLISYMGPGFFMVHCNTHFLSVMPSVSGALASIAVTVYYELFVSRKREELRDLFHHTMQEDLVDEMVESKTLPRLHGEHHELTALVSDHRLSSMLAAAFDYDATACMNALQAYLKTITHILLEEGASLETHARGSVTALFGAPLPEADHALRACRAVLRLVPALDEVKEEFAAQGLRMADIGFGINTGNMLIGNLGSPPTFTYTALGPRMDFAIWLEEHTSIYGVRILIGSATHQAIKDVCITRELDWVRDQETGNFLPVYELIGWPEEAQPYRKQHAEQYQNALSLYRAGLFEEALLSAQQALLCMPQDRATQFLCHACQVCKKRPPALFDGTLLPHFAPKESL